MARVLEILALLNGVGLLATLLVRMTRRKRSKGEDE
jgi:hypothetical protein